MRRTRIAYLTSEYPAPSHTFIRREVEALRARGIDIATFSIRRPPPQSRFAAPDREALRSTTYLLPARPLAVIASHLRAAATRPGAYLSALRLALRHRPAGVRALLWALFHFVEAIELAVNMRRQAIGHIHNHFANSSANVGLLASRYLGLPWSLTLHGSADWAYPAGYLLPGKIEAAEFVACVSQYGRAQAWRVTAPAHWDKLFIARCGVDHGSFPPRPPASPTDGRLRIVSVGRLSPEKGQLGLLEAFAKLLERGTDASLRLIGDGPLRVSLEARIADLGLGERCVLAGQMTETEVLSALTEADLFVLSSFLEGLPVVLLEALGMGVPVIAPSVAGIPELVRDGETGLLFTVGDWAALAEGMERAARDPELRRRMAEAGRRLVAREYDIDHAVAPLVARFAAFRS